MIKFSYVPIEMKKGVIITLYKGGNKRKDDPDSYRAITLSSVLLKLLERIVFTRIQLFDNLTHAGRVSKEYWLSDDFLFVSGVNLLRKRKW